MKLRKKLIEVALPLDAINAASKREKSIRHGHPSTLHLWWARRPLATARAVIFAQMVDDPSSREDLSIPEQDQERQRLFGIIERLVKWENTTNEMVLEEAREEIRASWRRTCLDNVGHPRAAELFNADRLPAFHDPFAGGGALPLEAQRLGLEAHASDLNPVAVLINKAMIEIPPKFAGKPPVNPVAQRGRGSTSAVWKGAVGIAEDVRYYGRWMRGEAQKRIGHLYPKVEVTAEMVEEQPDLKPYLGRKLTVIAWLWARTVKSPNPAFAGVDVPLASTFMLSTKKGKEAYVEPVIEGRKYRFTVKAGTPSDPVATRRGTKVSRGAFSCLLSGVPIKYSYIDDEANSGRMGVRLMAVVVHGDRSRVYLPPTSDMEALAHSAQPTWKPETPSRGTWASNAQGRRYGFRTFGDYFTPRQLVALTAFSDLVGDARERIWQDALATGFLDDATPLRDGGVGAMAYAEAVGVYLSFALSKQADLGNSLCRWEPIAQCPRQLFGRQAIPMVWDYAEGNPLGDSSGAWNVFIDGIANAFSRTFGTVEASASGRSQQTDAGSQSLSLDKVVSTDPPYYDNIGYADLSDFFYAWLRQSLKQTYPSLFATLAVPKDEELVASSYRHGGKDKAEEFFLTGMVKTFRNLVGQAHHDFPVTIYYAFKQSERRNSKVASTGWETFLDALIRSGFAISGTWPVRTENSTRLVGMTTNSLASSIVLVCRPHPTDAPLATRREFIAALRAELPDAVSKLQRGNVAPVDLAQAAIGPGMAIYTRFSKVLDAQGQPVTVRDALALINQTLDEALTEQEGDFDPDTRWALVWFEQAGFAEGEFGVAETLSRAKNTSVSGMVDASVVHSAGGKVRLLRPSELQDNWDPTRDSRITVWLAVHQIVNALETGGEPAAAVLLAELGDYAETARELCYRLYTMSERKGRAAEALSYNALVQSWPEIALLVRETSRERQGVMLAQTGSGGEA